MAVRSLWFESHLLGERAGKRARDAATRLGPAVHERILAAGDTLAAVSPAIAQQYYRQAAEAWTLLGADAFERWLQLGTDLITDHATPRDAGFGFFAITPKAVQRAGFESLQRWCERGRAISQRSRKLGAAFFTSTAPWVGRADIALLEAWATHGLALMSVSGWRGEFLAHAYLSGAEHALPVFSADDCRDWAALGAALQSAVKEQQFFAAVPAGIATLKPQERRWFFGAAIAMAQVSPVPAATFYAQLPPAIRSLHTNHRAKLLEAIGLAGPVIPTALAEIAPVAGALVRDLPAAARGAALDLLLTVARQFPAGIAALLRSLPMAYEDARHEAIVDWIARGLQIAALNAEAGSAFFALESRTSLKVLQESSTAVQLTDVQGLLRKYIQMLSGQSVSIRGSDFIEIPPPLEATPHELEVELPLRVDLFDTHEENVRLYRFLAAHLGGRREFGTYGITLPESAHGNLPEYLQGPEQPKLLERLFIVLEGFRVGRALARAYPGFGRDQLQVCRHTLQRYQRETDPALDHVFDTLFVWLLADLPLEDLPEWLATLAAIVAPCTPALAFAGSTANDSLQLAQTLARELELRVNMAQPGARGDILGEGLTGDALIAAYLYDDDDGPAVPNDMPGVTNPTDKPPPDKPADPMQLKVEEETDDGEGVTTAMSAEELQKLIEAGVELQLKQGRATDIEGLGMYITDLIGKVPTEQLQELRNLVEEATSQTGMPPKRWLEHRSAGRSYYYDEWDFHISDYRQRWCRLLETSFEGDSGEFFNRALQDYAAMIPEVRRQFQKIRPDMYRVVRGLEDGEDFDFNAVVDARVDRRARRAPSTKLYVARHREERDVATLFLIDMSASTDEPMEKVRPTSVGTDDPLDVIAGAASTPDVPTRPGRRIIDVTKEALVIMAEALEEIGDAYAIYGFSGHGRHNVEFYAVKHFNESLTTAVKGRIGAIEPKRSTRMGTALRHAVEKMSNITARSRHVILLSDGFPQDFDYGQDRRSNVYGLRDTSVALRECEAAGITPFCITVDKAGHDYLRVMCDTSRYMVIDDIAELPRELPKIYQRIVVT